MMLNIIILLSLFTLTLSSKLSQPKDDIEDENTLVLKQPTSNRNLRANGEILTVQNDLQLSLGVVNLIDAKTLNSIKSQDDYVKLRDRYQATIAQQRNIINQVTPSLPVMKTKLSANEAELLSIEYNLDSLKNESWALIEQLDALKRTRGFEKQEFQEKFKDSRALIIGIEGTQDNLRAEAVGDEDLNQVSVQHIMGLLKATKDSLEATMKQDIQAERQADKNYEDIVKKSNQVLANDKANIEKLSNRKKVVEPETVDLRNKIKTDTFRKSQAEVVMSQAITDLDELVKKFSERYGK